MRLWWTWVRRSYAPFFLPVGIGIALALRLDESTYDFRYEWYWASAESGSWLFFGGAVLAGASAWKAWLTRRRNQALTTAAPNPHAGRFSVFVGVVTWWLALHLLILAAHLVTAGLSGAVGEPAMLHLLTQFVAVVGWCGLGVAVGWWIRSPLAAPVLAALILISVPDPLPGVSLRGLTWFGSAASLVGMRFEPLALGLKLGFFAGLALLVVTTPRHGFAGRVLTVFGVTIAVAAAMLAVVPRSDLKPVPIADHTCTPDLSKIVVCGPPELKPRLSDISQALEPIVDDLQNLGVDPPATFRVHGRGGAVAPEPGVGWLAIAAVPLRSDVDIPTHALVEAATVPTSCGDPDEDSWVETMVLREAVYGWVLREWEVTAADGSVLYSPDLINDLHSLPPAKQREWFVEAYTTLWQCTESGLWLPEGITHPSVDVRRG